MNKPNRSQVDQNAENTELLIIEAQEAQEGYEHESLEQYLF